MVSLARISCHPLGETMCFWKKAHFEGFAFSFTPCNLSSTDVRFLIGLGDIPVLLYFYGLEVAGSHDLYKH